VKRMKIDITIVSGSRPGLLSRMLDSFHQLILPEFFFGNIYVNIDPFGGNSIDQKKCKKIILQYFPTATINMPLRPSFGAAVKYLWSLPTSRSFLHLEDDWLAVRRYHLDASVVLGKKRIRQIQLVKPKSTNLIWSRYRFRPLLQNRIFVPNFTRPNFTTAPSLIETCFAKEVSKLMDPELDPEKQFFNGENPHLENFMRPYRTKSLVSFLEKPIIQDIGRNWQKENGIAFDFLSGRRIYRKL